ncbi:hypothetical protein C5S32_02065, partial [ANME-1 cluster archaeon GoMg1]|nr:hypothetical protein [ANME-1 cluster archaeon GoMg1]
MIKSEIKQILAITGLSLLLFAIVSVSPVVAEIATATRTLPAEPVSAGEFFSVRIEAS